MTTITTDTIIRIITAKPGSSPKTHEERAGEFINRVKFADVDGDLDVGVEAITDEDGEHVTYTEDKFFELPIEEKLAMCCKRVGKNHGATVTYEVA